MTTKSDAPTDPGAQATPAPKPDDAAATGAPPEQSPAPEPKPDEQPDWKALAEKWERQAKNDRKTLEGLKTSMQGLLTPEQVADQAQAAAAAQSAATTSAQEALRLRVALEKSVPAGLVDRLIGTTREELEADAALLLSTVAPPAPPPPPPSRVPDAGAGTGRATPPQHDLNQLLRIAAGVAGDDA